MQRGSNNTPRVTHAELRRAPLVQHTVPRLRCGFAREVNDLDPRKVLNELDAFGRVDHVRMEHVVHLMELEIVFHSDVRPGGICPVPTQVILVARTVPRIKGCSKGVPLCSQGGGAMALECCCGGAVVVSTCAWLCITNTVRIFTRLGQVCTRRRSTVC